MAISENQLSTWSNQGATVSSVQIYNSIKTCIDVGSWNDDVSYNIYLQGSYKNTTNTRGDSDVDVVVEFSSVFYSNKLELPEADLQAYKNYYEEWKYTLKDFKTAVMERLEEYYGHTNVTVGSKSKK